MNERILCVLAFLAAPFVWTFPPALLLILCGRNPALELLSTLCSLAVLPSLVYFPLAVSRRHELWARWRAWEHRPEGKSAWLCLLAGPPLAACFLLLAVIVSKSLGVGAVLVFLPFAAGVVMTLAGALELLTSSRFGHELSKAWA